MKKNAIERHNLLLNRALDLVRAGISVIPVWGNAAPREPKKPTIKWRAYQKRTMTEAEVKGAFTKSSEALGIVCGRISGLIVIDFDDHLRYRRFCRHRPDLAASYTVKTRRGYHVYFRTDEKVPTHQFDGGDIKGERSYVVAPPSVIDGFAYRRVSGSNAIRVDQAVIDSLLNYFHLDTEPLDTSVKLARNDREIDLITLYQRLAPRLGRNNALYRAASAARDRGIGQTEAEARLSILHAQAGRHPGHKYETISDRLREAQRTVGSAYRRNPADNDYRAGLPNSVRETLLKEQGSTVVARLLDILYLEGWQAESYFTLREAVAASQKYGLNRKSVLQSLTGELSTFNGRHIIARRYVEYLDIRGLYSRKRGRPVELVFQMPSAGRLLWVLGVSVTPSDRIDARDVKSAHAYRRALHREYIRRLSPRLPMRVMAERLGVNARTLRRYNRDLGVSATAHVGRFALSWENLRCLPRRRRGDARGATAGYWLETPEGYRSPAWRHIGAAMLRRGESGVQVCAQGTSAWSLESAPSAQVRYERLSVEEFIRLRVLRDDNEPAVGTRGAVKRLWDRAKSLASKLRYERLRLSYESVSACIAEDKVAETIGGYLCALDDRGREVRRPARRGVAYRMLKEFGNGNVYLALRDSYREMMLTLAGHAARGDEERVSIDLLAPMLA